MKRLVPLLVLAACGSDPAPAPVTPQPQYAPSAYPGQPGAPGAQPYPGQPTSPTQPTAPARPLLAPLVGTAAMQQEVQSVLNELMASLSAQNQSLVRGIPLVFDPTVEVNAYAGCDDSGQPFLAGTAGILEAVDAIAQTKATDQLFGTQTYDAYCAAVLPAMAQSDKARAALPAGIIPANYGSDPRRWSRAHEIFDEVIAFTFGHELGHHYLGHTGCAKGQGTGAGPDPAKLGRLLTVIPLFNQAAEAAADTAGAIDALDSGRRRRPQYEWSEAGAVTLLDYFARLERAGGGGGIASIFSPSAFLRTHPNPLARIPLVQTVAQTWHYQHPG